MKKKLTIIFFFFITISIFSDPFKMLKTGDELYRNGNYAAAAEIYKDIVPHAEFFKNPDELYYRLVLTYQQLQRFDLVFYYYSIIINKYKNSIYIEQALDFNIDYLKKQYKLKEALELINIAIKISNYAKDYLMIKAELLEEKGEIPAAMKIYKSMLKNEIYNKDIIKRIIALYIKDNNIQEGIDFLRGFKKENEMDWYISSLLGDLYAAEDKIEEAEKEYNYCFERSLDPIYLIKNGDLYLKKDREKALNYYYMIIKGKTFPTRDDFILLGNTLFKHGFYKEVLELYEKKAKAHGYLLKDNLTRIYSVLGMTDRFLSLCFELLEDNKNTFDWVSIKLEEAVSQGKRNIIYNSLKTEAKKNKKIDRLLLKILTFLQIKDRDYINAINTIDTLVSSYKTNPSFIYDQAMSLLIKKEYAGAILFFQNYLKKNISQSEKNKVILKLGKIYLKIGKYIDAENTVLMIDNSILNKIPIDQESISKSYTLTMAVKLLTVINLNSGNIEKAKQYLKLLSSTEDDETEMIRAKLYYLDDKFDKSLESIELLGNSQIDTKKWILQVEAGEKYYMRIINNIISGKIDNIETAIKDFTSNYASTSQCIDLIELLTIIKDEPELASLYLRIKKNIFINSLLKAEKDIIYVKENYSSSISKEKIVFLKGDLLYKKWHNVKKDEIFTHLVNFYLNFIKNTKNTFLKETALNNLGKLYTEYGDSVEAINFYNKLLTNYPDSIYSYEVRNILKEKKTNIINIKQ